MDQTLKKRAITAVFFTIAVLMLLYTNSITQLLLFMIIGVGSSYELLTISKSKNLVKWVLTLVIALLYIASYLINVDEKLAFIIVMMTCVFHFVYALNLFYGKAKLLLVLPYSVLFYPAASCFIIINELSTTNNNITITILAMILLIWLNDSFAYLVGRKIGKRKLFERISPNKTWEGFYGGGLATIIGSIVIYYLFDLYSISQWLVIGVLVWLGGVIGDLMQSAIKRRFEVKDSGNILPGHGGFFDRFDSLIFVIPFVYLILKYFNY